MGIKRIRSCPQDLKELDVTVRLRNNRLKVMREARGLSQEALGRRIGMSNAVINRLENLHDAAFNIDSGWRQAAKKLARFFRCQPEDLFPPGILRLIESKIPTRMTRTVDVEELPLLTQRNTPSLLPSPEEALIAEEAAAAVEETIATLTPRQQEVITKRFGLGDRDAMSLREVGRKLAQPVQSERVRQIEAKALRCLRHPSRSKRLQEKNLDGAEAAERAHLDAQQHQVARSAPFHRLDGKYLCRACGTIIVVGKRELCRGCYTQSCRRGFGSADREPLFSQHAVVTGQWVFCPRCCPHDEWSGGWTTVKNDPYRGEAPPELPWRLDTDDKPQRATKKKVTEVVDASGQLMHRIASPFPCSDDTLANLKRDWVIVDTLCVCGHLRSQHHDRYDDDPRSFSKGKWLYGRGACATALLPAVADRGLECTCQRFEWATNCVQPRQTRRAKS